MENDKITPFLLMIIGAAVVLAVGLIIMGQFGDTIGDSIQPKSIINESIVSWTNQTFTALNHTTCITLACSEARNNESTVLTGTNYTCDTRGINLTDAGGTVFNITNTLTVNYTCTLGNAAYNATSNMTTKLATFPTWIGMIIVVALATLVLGYFYGRKN